MSTYKHRSTYTHVNVHTRHHANKCEHTHTSTYTHVIIHAYVNIHTTMFTSDIQKSVYTHMSTNTNPIICKMFPFSHTNRDFLTY